MKLSLGSINLGLVLLLVLVMGGQRGFDLPFGKPRFPVTVADAVLALAAAGVAVQLVARRFRGVKLPPIQAFALVAVACVALARSEAKAEAAKELLQAIEYFLIAFAVFLNVAGNAHVKALLAAFAIGTAGIVAWAGWEYAARESAFDVRACFLNRNALGAFLALALPVLYGLALYVRSWAVRLALLAVVAAGLLVNLSGGAVLITLAVLGLLSALRGQRALAAYLAAVAVIAFAAPRVLPRPYHTRTLVASVSPFVRDNWLLSDRQLFERAAKLRELARAESEAALKAGHAEGSRRLFDACSLMELLADRRGGSDRLADEERQLYGKLAAEAEAAAKDFPAKRAECALSDTRLAVRYQSWDAAIRCAKRFWDRPATALFGLGYVEYHEAIKPFRQGPTFNYRGDVREAFNVGFPEPFTHDIWLKALVQTGLVGLLAVGWFLAAFLGRALRLHGTARSELMLGVALGAAGGILGFALAGIFTETLARGLAMPLVFVCSLVVIAERIVHGENGSKLEKSTAYEY